MRESGHGAELVTKRTLVAVSHAIEHAALAAADDRPMVMFALFQRLPYLHRERDVYERISRQSAATVVGLVQDGWADVPSRVHQVGLRPDEELAREWAVIALTPRFGAALVARDLEQLEPAEATLEQGRLFEGWWRFHRDTALAEVVRLRAALADRLAPAVCATIDTVIEGVGGVAADPAEPRLQAAMQVLTSRVRREQVHNLTLTARLDELGGGPERDPATGLATERFLRRWAGEHATTASGTLPLGLVALRVNQLAGMGDRLGTRSAVRAIQLVAQVLTSALRPMDRAVRLADDDFLLVLPSVTEPDTAAVANWVAERLAGLATEFPFVAFGATAVLAVTRQRPLPITELRAALKWATQQGVPIASLPADRAAVPGG